MVCRSSSSFCSLSSLTTPRSRWFCSCNSSMFLKSTSSRVMIWEELEMSALLSCCAKKLLVLATPPLASSTSFRSSYNSRQEHLLGKTSRIHLPDKLTAVYDIGNNVLSYIPPPPPLLLHSRPCDHVLYYNDQCHSVRTTKVVPK